MLLILVIRRRAIETLAEVEQLLAGHRLDHRGALQVIFLRLLLLVAVVIVCKQSELLLASSSRRLNSQSLVLHGPDVGLDAVLVVR